jgi:hypothetical protein
VIKCETINGRSFRPKIELLRKRGPLRLLLTDELRGCLGRVGAADGKAQRYEPLLNLWAAQELPDVPVQLRHDVSGRANRCNYDQPAVQLEARQGLRDGGQLGRPGKRFAELSAIRLTLPARAKPSTAAKELIITWVVPTEVSCIICGVVPPRRTDVGPIRATCPFWPPEPWMKYATNGELNSYA